MKICVFVYHKICLSLTPKYIAILFFKSSFREKNLCLYHLIDPLLSAVARKQLKEREKESQKRKVYNHTHIETQPRQKHAHRLRLALLHYNITSRAISQTTTPQHRNAMLSNWSANAR
jgi:hypothetical protein